MKLNTETHGVFILEADGEEYICASLLLEYKINAIPSARVTIGFGTGLKDTSRSQDPSILLAKVLGNRDDAYNAMVECTISERYSDGLSVPVFTGVIVTGTPIYRASDKYSSKMVSLLCLNKICMLYTSPLSSFITAHSSFVLDRMTATGQILTAADARREGKATGATKFDIYRLVDDAVPDTSGDVLSNVDSILNTYLQHSSYKPENGTKPRVLSLSDYLFSRVRVNPALMKGANLGKSFYHRVGLQMSTMLANMSVYDVLQRMLITDEFMLNLVPRFSTQDFKVELVPSYMWKTRESDNLDINATDLVAVSAVFNPIACLNIPQVLMVLFEDPIEYGKKLVGGGAATNYGVYSTDKQLNELMRSKRSTGTSTSENASEVDGYYRYQVMRAPAWLYPKAEKKSNGNSNTVLGDDFNKAGNDQAPEPPEPDDITKDNITEYADKIAQALFVYKYGRQDTATLKLSAALRFQYLEEHLGGTVNVKLAGPGKNPMNFRGVLNSVTFSYVSGASSQVEYSAELVCVRPISEREQSIECVLYEDL